MQTLAMSENGRVLIPANIREQLGLKPKTRIHIEIKDGCLVLTPAALHYSKIRAYFDTFLPPTPGRSMTDAFIAERRAEAAREDAA